MANDEITTLHALEWFVSRQTPLPGTRMMYDKAIAALRAQLEAEQNEPLTAEELQGMDGEPLWAMCLIKQDMSCWGYIDDGLFIGYRMNFFVGNYGDTWLAYRHKPEDGVNGSYHQTL